jgi:uncharacterized protein (DUF1499 family)
MRGHSPLHLLLLTLMVFGCTGKRPEGPMITGGRLPSCPASPNCVSSQSDDPDHFIEPIRYDTSRVEARTRLRKVIESMDRAEILRETDEFLQVEFTTALMRFKDDGLFYFDENEPVIHMRSASRVGHSDLGKNRKRLEKIRRAFQEAASR